MSQPPAPLFSSARHRAQRDRMARQPAGADFLAPIIAETLLDRLSMVTRDFARTLLIGAHDAALIDHLRGTGTALTLVEAGPGLAAATGAVESEVNALDLPFASFDLILWPGGFDSVNDVPGALVRLRALLAPDGLLLGSFVGDGSLARLRRATMADGVRPIARMHPQVDLAAMGNLLQRTGFTLPVVDVEALTVRYADWFALVRDLRAAGLSSRLAAAPPPLTRDEVARIALAFTAQADADGRIAESFRLIHFSGWAPHPDQPRPARRGSGTASLADALKPRPDQG
ncbi:methyltransferase type 12 [Sphingopyxis sp. YF1]|uniref:methyltransferase domain-containing protein n=1 Tax=Sphingopyxis sp. YF1 TaxID=2482763 RepID=UPI001F61EE12|nr:methyltransferase domain-containing protein [Sphingopyxis sp. YF1]UNU43807.1 methyltransferase type 12 [Sphingopyxis sp. YF1]